VSPTGLEIEEGAKFLDWNDDGRLDLLLHDPYEGPQLYENVGSRTSPVFRLRTVRPDGLGPEFAERHTSVSGTTYNALAYCASYGLNIYDLDNDGFEDVMIAGSVAPVSPGCDYPNAVFRNTGLGFEIASAGGISGWQAGGVFAFGDINRDGRIDVLYVGPFPYYFVNATDTSARGSFVVDVRGADGRENQHGRVLRVALPKPGCSGFSGPGCTLTRVVDGGSGYHSQNQYPILVGTPYEGAHEIEILFPAPANPATTVAVRATASPGQRLRILAPSLRYPTGRVIYE
jgi:hypothetical protein